MFGGSDAEDNDATEDEQKDLQWRKEKREREQFLQELQVNI